MPPPIAPTAVPIPGTTEPIIAPDAAPLMAPPKADCNPDGRLAFAADAAACC